MKIRSFELTGTKYQQGQTVQATVRRVLPFGVQVELTDNTRGVIRRRELSWDRPVSDQHMRTIAPVGHPTTSSCQHRPQISK
ncbi:MAG: S1 RNA-binding domain-containing protein [Anaerolineae bacterium]|nr:S1 RNA-binding domain-containing protein [Anaerolineae bacterium]